MKGEIVNSPYRSAFFAMSDDDAAGAPAADPFDTIVGEAVMFIDHGRSRRFRADTDSKSTVSRLPRLEGYHRTK